VEKLITHVFSCIKNGEKMEKIEEGLMGYNVTKSVRIDAEMADRLEKIGLYEKTRSATLMRMWVQDKILTYYRNPKFKQWLKKLGLIPMKRKT